MSPELLSPSEPSQTSSSFVPNGPRFNQKYELNAKQAYLADSRLWSNECLFGGAKGGGKSFLIRYLWCLFASCCPGFVGYIFRRTYEELWDNHMEGETSFPQMLSYEVERGECAIVKKEVRWANGSRIFLRHMQLEKHKFKYQGMSIHGAAFDEATQFTETQIRFVLMSVRLGGWAPPSEFPLADRLPFVLYGANPGGVGHDFIKSRLVDLGPLNIVRATDPGQGASFRQFVPALYTDNPELLRNDPLYIERLSVAGDPVLVRAMRDGDWSIVAGSMFGEVWHEGLVVDGRAVDWHVCDPFPVPMGWSIWRGGDDGFASPSAVYWLTRDPDTATIYVVSEIYQAGLTAPELAERVLDRDRSIALYDAARKATVLNKEPLRGNYDSSAFSNVGQAEITRGDQMNRAGCAWTPVDKWPGSRKARVQDLHRLLKPSSKERGKKPGIVFFRRCVNAIRTIPRIMRDPGDREDVSDESEIHAFDGVTYAVQYKELKAGRVRVM